MTLNITWMVLFWGWIASEWALAFTTYTRSKSGHLSDRGSLRVLWIVIGGAITAGTWYGDSHPNTIFHGAHAVRVCAVVLMLLGLILRWTAIFQLGRSFSVNVAIHATQTVHKTGLFRLVRHPSYTGLLMIFFAVGLFTRNWIGVVILFLPTAALLYRIRVEEAALRHAFGTEYIAYSRDTSRLLPGIY